MSLHQSLHDLFVQLPPPLVIMGDFNSYNRLWGSETTDACGISIEGVVNELDLNILNNGNSTRVSYGIESCLDLTIVSNRLEPLTPWSVAHRQTTAISAPLLSTSWKIDP